MKLFILRRSLPAVAGVLIATSCFGAPPSVAGDPEPMTAPPDTEASQDKFRMIRFLLEDKHSMIEMFTNYGLLSPTELQSRTQLVNEVTNTHIESLIGKGNKSQWFDEIPKLAFDPLVHAPREKHSLDEDHPSAKRVNVIGW